VTSFGTVTIGGIIANGSTGAANQVLTSNGSTIYWANATGGISFTTDSSLTLAANVLSVNAAYINTISANNTYYLSGVTLSQIQANITSNSATAYANAVANATYQAGIAYSNAVATAAADATSKATTAYTNAVADALSGAAPLITGNAATAYANAVAYAASNAYVNSTFAQNTAIYAYAASNAYVNSTFAQNTSVYTVFAQNTAIYAYAASNSYVNSTFQTIAGLSANVATLTANSANYIGSIPAGNVATLRSNTTLTSVNYNVLSTDDFIIANGTINIQLSAASTNTGRKYNVQNSGIGQVTVLPNGTDTINGRANVVLLYKNSLIGVMPSNSSNWLIF
jgi:hypothetical protein